MPCLAMRDLGFGEPLARKPAESDREGEKKERAGCFKRGK